MVRHMDLALTVASCGVHRCKSCIYIITRLSEVMTDAKLLTSHSNTCLKQALQVLEQLLGLHEVDLLRRQHSPRGLEDRQGALLDPRHPVANIGQGYLAAVGVNMVRGHR